MRLEQHHLHVWAIRQNDSLSGRCRASASRVHVESEECAHTLSTQTRHSERAVRPLYVQTANLREALYISGKGTYAMPWGDHVTQYDYEGRILLIRVGKVRSWDCNLGKTNADNISLYSLKARSLSFLITGRWRRRRRRLWGREGVIKRQIRRGLSNYDFT